MVPDGRCAHFVVRAGIGVGKGGSTALGTPIFCFGHRG